MRKTERESRTGEDLSPVQEVAEAMGGFLNDFNGFRADMQSKLQQTEERLTMLDRKTHIAARPQLAAGQDLDLSHKSAFRGYLQSGDDDGLRGLELDGKSLSTAVNSDGGYLVDPQTSEEIRTVLHNSASIRSVANVVNVEATSFDVLVDRTEAGAGWATEAADATETDTPTIERITIPLHELSALPKASQRLLDDSAFDIEGWLAKRIAEKFARAEASAFVTGDGVDKPRGFLNHTKVLNSNWNWQRIGFLPTGADGALASADPIVDLIYALDAEYRPNATFVMSSKTAATIRKMKDADGRFLWSDGLAAGEPAQLMGYPVMISEDMPEISNGSFSIAFGDFAAGYTIAERPDMRVLRDPFSAKPHVLFYATKRVGGDVSDFNAIKLLKFSAS
ncbi:MAG: phage major capsid protein [Marinibacterium sp.]|nr:phage major capsid protein [Marinibacterium sp.]